MAIKHINSGRSPGLDGIPVDLLKVKSFNVNPALFDLLTQCWNGSPLPNEWIDGALVCLYKGKGDKGSCDNYRGITLLGAVSKVLSRILLNRLLFYICPVVIPESQSGFRSGRGTNDMIFLARQVREKCIEQRVPLYQVFVDLTKAFDTVNRDALWTILGKVGCPPVFVNLLKRLHNGMKARIVMSGRLSDEIPIDNGVKQGDVLAPTLFSIFFSVILSHAFQHCEKGVLLEFRTTGRVFDLRRFNFKSKTSYTLI